MRTLVKSIILPLCFLLTFVAAAAAEESVCDSQTGAAYGLCTAYCEAMDCDGGAPQASQQACDRVRNNFARITGQGLPCDAVCPCVGGYLGFIETLNGQNGTLQSCTTVPGASGDELVVLFTSGDFIPFAELMPEGRCGNFNSFPQFITMEEGQACINLIKQKAAAAGIECVPSP